MRIGVAIVIFVLLGWITSSSETLDQQLDIALAEHGFTGRIESTLERRLGRKLDNQLADLGRLLFFDTVGGLNNDNNCAGCHSPTNGFGDTQSIAIGIDNNGIVGPDRATPTFATRCCDESITRPNTGSCSVRSFHRYATVVQSHSICLAWPSRNSSFH
jgi:cytochrome c peroxidase